MDTQNRTSSGTTSGQSQDTTTQAKEKAVEVKDQAQEKAAEMAEKAKAQVQTQLAGQKERATEQLGSITSALRQTSDNLRDEDQDMIAGYMEQAASQVEGLSSYLRNHTVGEMLDEARSFAKREPTLFVGGAMLLGLFGARFFRSSSPRGRSNGYRRRSPRYAGSGSGSGSGYRREPENIRSYEQSGEYPAIHGTEGATMPRPTGSRSTSPSPRVTNAGATNPADYEISSASTGEGRAQ